MRKITDNLNQGDDNAKLALLSYANTLYKNESPDFRSFIEYPKVTDLKKTYGDAEVMKVLFGLVHDFCRSINVIRNMNETQMLEVADMLLNDPGNFRMEDYISFFKGCKRGRYGVIRDRLDIQMISDMLDDYWLERHQVSNAIQEAEWDESRPDEVVLSHQKRNEESKELRAVQRIGNLFGFIRDRLK